LPLCFCDAALEDGHCSRTGSTALGICPTISLIKIHDLDRNRFFGFGGRGVLNFSDLLGADLQFARVAAQEFFAPSNSRTEYSHHQYIASLKVTWRPQNARRINPFGLAGMGLARDGVSSTFGGPFPGSFADYQNKLALRLGGGAEFIPHDRFSIRLDVSDFASRVPSTGGRGGAPARWWNRLDGGIAIMVRLGTIH
jgi:hypothetical protein